MMKDEEDFTEEQQMEEPEVKSFTDSDLFRIVGILFVFAVYFFIFLKIMVLS